MFLNSSLFILNKLHIKKLVSSSFIAIGKINMSYTVSAPTKSLLFCHK